MLIAQISDLHIRPPGELYKGVADSNRMLTEAIDHLHHLDRAPDLVLVTGDLVDEGQPQEYAHAVQLLNALSVRFLVIPGNHDHRDHLRTAFSAHAYLPRQGPLHYCVNDYPVRIVALDTCPQGLHHGALDADGLAWLQDTLATDPTKPTLLLMHHPPFLSGIPYMDQYRYIDVKPLADIVGRFANIEAVLCGHVHRAMVRRWAGTVVATCPSTTTEIALQLQPEAAPQSFFGPPACLLHLWDPENGLISHTSYIGQYEGPYPFF
jgi:3',5'-cyclic-AMP phosphodiesterase